MTHRLRTRVVTHSTQCREPHAEYSSGVRDSSLRMTIQKKTHPRLEWRQHPVLFRAVVTHLDSGVHSRTGISELAQHIRGELNHLVWLTIRICRAHNFICKCGSVYGCSHTTCRLVIIDTFCTLGGNKTKWSCT